MYGECDYCHEFRAISNRTRFCHECLEEFRRVEEKYFDGDMAQYLVDIVKAAGQGREK